MLPGLYMLPMGVVVRRGVVMVGRCGDGGRQPSGDDRKPCVASSLPTYLSFVDAHEGHRRIGEEVAVRLAVGQRLLFKARRWSTRPEATVHITEQEAAAIYARACLAWYRGRARQVVGDVIKQLRRKGDLSGVKVWTKVAVELAKTEAGRAKRMAS